MLTPQEYLAAKLLPFLTVDESQLAALGELLANKDVNDYQICFVTRYPAAVETKLLELVCKRSGIPIPEDLSTAPYPDLHAASHPLFSLRRRSGQEITRRQRSFYRRSLAASINSLIKSRAGSTIIFVPVSFSAGRGPSPLPTRLNPTLDFPFLPLGDLWNGAVLSLYRHSLRLEIGPGVLWKKKARASEILNLLSRSIYRMEKLHRGAKQHERPTVETIVLSGSQFERTVDDVAVETSSSRTEVVGRAKGIFREIAADLNGKVVSVLRQILVPIFEKIFAGVTIRNVDNLREAEQHPIILLPNHRSHFDYLLLSYALDKMHLPLPLIAAGDNLNFFPIGPFLRRSGGFFIRRKIDNDPLYKLILDRYLTYLVKQGHTVEFYIEGGRSRTGLLLPPRLGLLKYIIRAVLEGNRRDVVFVPVGINYEHVAEHRAIVGERSGAKKVKENFAQFLTLRTMLKKRFGSVTIRFGKPISLRALISEEGDGTGGEKRPSELPLVTAELARAIAVDIEKNIAATLSGLAASALISLPRGGHTLESLLERVGKLGQVILACYPEEATNQQQHFALSDALQNFLRDPQNLTPGERIRAHFRPLGILGEGEESSAVELTSENLLLIDYYKNMSLHALRYPAVTMLISTAVAAGFETALASEVLYALLGAFQPLPDRAVWEEEIKRCQMHLQAAGFLEPQLEFGALTPEGRETLGPSAAVLQPWLSLALCAVEAFITNENREDDPVKTAVSSFPWYGESLTDAPPPDVVSSVLSFLERMRLTENRNVSASAQETRPARIAAVRRYCNR